MKDICRITRSCYRDFAEQIAADLCGRVIFAPGEMPVGVLMALLGAPFFLVILLKGGKRDA